MLHDISADSRFVDIGDLPSGQKPYTFTQLFIRPLSVNELKLISQAAMLEDVRHLIRAVDLVIDQDVHDITIGDFFYILMWLRVKSYPKSPIIVNWKCSATYHVELDETGKDLRVFPSADVTPDLLESGMIAERQCSKQNTESIRMSNIEITCIPDDFAGLPEGFDYPRVRILPEIVEYTKKSEYVFILPAAQWIRQGKTLKDKFEALEKAPDLDLFETAFNLSEEVVHGIKENIMLKCANCGTQYPHTLELNPLTFFRK
jgi:hypothetical protein